MSDAIFISGGPGRLKLTFSQPVLDPVIAIASLGLTNGSRSINIRTAMWFEQSFEILSNQPLFLSGGQIAYIDQPDYAAGGQISIDGSLAVKRGAAITMQHFMPRRPTSTTTVGPCTSRRRAR